jgi:hypothetical protein
VQPRGFRYLHLTVRNAPSDVFIDEISFLSAQYPVQKTGRFNCSDPVLNKIWELGAVTQSVNMEDAYDDCVDRERGLYAMDMLIQYHINLACFGDHKLMKRCMELFARSAHETGLFRCVYPNTGHYILPDFCLYVSDAFYCYYRYTGDTAFIKKHWNAIMTNLDVFGRLSDERPDVLLNADPPAGNWPAEPVDNLTGFVGDGERTVNAGVNCIFSCLYLIALRGAYQMAKAIGENECADDLNRRIEKITAAVSDVFWDEEKGLFADNIDMDRFSPHASLFAVKAGAAAPEQCERLAETVPPLLTPFFTNGYDPEEGYAFSTHFALYMFDALYDLDLTETAERCIRDGWGYFVDRGLKTTSEHWTLGASQCHAWSAAPAYALSRHALGVSFDALNGGDNVKVDIEPGTLSWAKGAFPHPKGEIEIEWRIENGRVIIGRLSLPDGVK